MLRGNFQAKKHIYGYIIQTLNQRWTGWCCCLDSDKWMASGSVWMCRSSHLNVHNLIIIVSTIVIIIIICDSLMSNHWLVFLNQVLHWLHYAYSVSLVVEKLTISGISFLRHSHPIEGPISICSNTICCCKILVCNICMLKLLVYLWQRILNLKLNLKSMLMVLQMFKAIAGLCKSIIHSLNVVKLILFFPHYARFLVICTHRNDMFSIV